MSSTAIEATPELAIGLQGLMKKWKANTKHAKHVTELAETLFHALAPLHGLPAERLDWLRAAALLHDLGHFIDERGHHRHSAYIIANDPAFATWPDAARAAIALVALNHRKARERGLEDLSRSEAREVRQLAALLRMADVLDYENRQDVSIAAVELDQATHLVTVRLKGAYDLIAHEARLQRKVGWAAEQWKALITYECGDQAVRIAP